MKTWGLLLKSILIASSLSGCGYAMEEMGLFKTGDIILKTPKVNEFSESLIDYYIVNKTSLRTCLDCHTSKAPVLDTEESVYDNRDDIMATVESGDMPPRHKGYLSLSACELQILRSYFDNKTNNRAAQRVKELPECSSATAPAPTPAPTVTPSPTVTPTPPTTQPGPPGPPGAPPAPPKPPGPPGPPPPPPTNPPGSGTNPTPTPTPQPDLGQLELSFKNLRMAFFDAKCLSCHSDLSKRPKDPRLDSVARIVEAKDMYDKPIVTPRSGVDSFLYKITVPGLTDSIMPPARLNMPLTAAEADYLKRWIDAGMPE
ncbi:hypothetical protein B9G69_011745 [Bdellovibrio sp. SKB1291214]|uniref:hypothetical protein n=1 Tax=Bdellovibrio sp. SKB1291214 TaxID=1732569 RepID=UPI001131D892|nr:hypothetical protein [Bdellovibrio sp. SKB1291214]UYL07719.1 hypothetical protein B9G69_011745 [Bdellovibrio sp. SKB1291214]